MHSRTAAAHESPWRVAFERIETQNGTGTYTQFGESILGMLIRKQGTGTYYTRLPDGSLLSQRTPAGTHYYLEDGLGSIVGMTDANGALVASYVYDPYGWVLYEKPGSPYNPWRYKSGYQSQTTLHYKFGHRWYDPQTGRWTQADPLEQPTSPGDWNRYAYVAGEPVRSFDPMGLGVRDALRRFAEGSLAASYCAGVCLGATLDGTRLSLSYQCCGFGEGSFVWSASRSAQGSYSVSGCAGVCVQAPTPGFGIGTPGVSAGRTYYLRLR